MRSILLFFSVLFVLNVFGQQTEYIYLAKGLQQPTEATHVWVEPSTESIEQLGKNIKLLTNLQAVKINGVGEVSDIDRLLFILGKLNVSSLTLENNAISSVPEKISNLKNLESFTITGNPQINYSSLVSELSKTKTLIQLNFIENDLKKLPKEITTIENLSCLSIEGNDQMNFKKAVKTLTKLPNLRELKLPINQMSELPSNIGTLNKLELLDLRNNIITELEDDMEDMDSLSSLQLEGNIIVDPVDELAKVKNLNIRYITLDKGLTEEDKKQLKTFFPNAAIIEKGSEEEVNHSVATEDTEKATNVIRVRKEESVRVLSDAYLHYAGVFNLAKYGTNIDNTLFEERYADFGYVGIWARQPNTEYENIKLSLYHKSKKNEIWFDFERTTKGKNCYGCYIYKNNPEINAFIGMKWVYVGAIDKKEFKESYVKNKHYDDFRVFYDQEKLNYTIELKHEKGYDKIAAYPRYANKKVPLDQSQRTYQKRYERYLSNLDRRKKRFNRMMGNQRRSLAKIEEMRKDEWGAFTDAYMSEQEKVMTKDEWLNYYHKVVAQEQSALFNSKANTSNLLRSLEISGYVAAKSNTAQSCSVVFNDSKSNNFTPFKVIVLEHTTKTLQQYNAPLRREPVSIQLEKNNKYSIIVEDVNGDIGVYNQNNNTLQLDASKKLALVIEMKRFKNKLTTVADVRKYLSK